MATWIAHLRIAENLLQMGFEFLPVPFVVGNIGPDSGVPNSDWSVFDPPKKITHWLDERNKINPERFYGWHLGGEGIRNNTDYFSFCMGYYAHLLTDVEWSRLYERKKGEPLYKENLDRAPGFIWIIKKDWYGLDFEYLRENPNSIFYSCFKDIDHVPDYLDYFPPKAFQRQVRYITGFYLGENEQTKNGFVYLTKWEMDDFITAATEVVRYPGQTAWSMTTPITA